MSDILAEPLFDWLINLLRLSTFSYKEEKSIIRAIQSVTLQTYFIDENVLRRNQYLLRYSLPHYRALYCAAFIHHLQSQHLVSTFGIEKVFGSMKTLPAIQKMLVSSADFSTRPVGRALWEESLLFSKSHTSIRADEWNFCPLILFKKSRGYSIYKLITFSKRIS